MNYHLLLLFLAITIFFLIFILLWKHGRISKQDILSLTAVIISLAVGLFTLLSRSLPTEIEVYHTNTTLFNLPEENKNQLLSECLYLDLKNNTSKQAQEMNKELIKRNINVNTLSKSDFILQLKGTNFQNYNASEEVVNNFIGKDPCSIPIILSLSFVNKTPNPVTIDDIYIIISNSKERMIYKPMYHVDAQKLFSNNIKKTAEAFDKPFHPFLLSESADKEMHLFFIKWNLKNFDSSPNTNQLNIGDNKIELIYHTTNNHTYSKFLPSININKNTLLDLYNGNKISIAEDSELFKKLLYDKN